MGDSADAAGGDTAAEERLVLRALAALVAFLFATATAVALTRADEGEPGDGVPTVGGEPVYSGAGPLPGADVPTYVAGRTDVLPRVEGRVTVVVSFRAYEPEREARALLVGLDVVGLLVAAPGGAPVVVTGGLDRWAVGQRSEAEAELANLASMLKTTEDPDFRAEFEADIARLTGLLDHLDTRAAIVFGAVLTVDASELPALVQRADVRLVDVVGRGAPDDPTVLVGLRPEETERAGTPRTRPLP